METLEKPRTVPIRAIQDETCRQFGVSRMDLLSRRRTADVVIPRQVAMYLAKELTLHSYPSIGRLFDHRDHTTILSAVRKIDVKMCNPEFAEKVNGIRARLDLSTAPQVM